MTTLKLLIREIDPSTHNGRYLRENLRRIKQFLDDVETGAASLVTFQSISGTVDVPDNVESFDVASLGQTVFTLSATPTNPTKATMTINGVQQTNGEHFTISGNIATFNPATAGFTLEVSNEFSQPDRVVVNYFT